VQYIFSDFFLFYMQPRLCNRKGSRKQTKQCRKFFSSDLQRREVTIMCNYFSMGGNTLRAIYVCLSVCRCKANGTRPNFSAQVAHTKHTRNWHQKHGVFNFISLPRLAKRRRSSIKMRFQSCQSITIRLINISQYWILRCI